jgi:phage-related protein
MSTLPLATRLSRRQQIPADMDDQLVRRNIFDNIKHAFQSFGNKVKEGFQNAGNAIKNVAQKVGNGIKSVAQKIGGAVSTGFQKVKQGFQTAGNAIKNVAQKVGNGIKSVAQKVGSGIKTAAEKTWGWMKTTGAKAAKFGLKVLQSVDSVVGKVANFIPGIGKPLSKAIDAESKIAGFVSDHINVKLPDNLEKGMKVMETANKVMDYIPRRREFLEVEEDAFQQRDIDGTYFEERDDFAFLESRDDFDERNIYKRYYDDLDWE